MSFHWRDAFGRAVCILGLALLTQLAYAGQMCQAVSTLAQAAGPAPACIGEVGEVDLSVAATSPPPDQPPLAVAARRVATIAETNELRFTPGLMPGFRVPAYILFGRHLA